MMGLGKGVVEWERLRLFLSPVGKVRYVSRLWYIW